MLSKALAVVHSKVALAALGVVLVGGGGTAVAYAAANHQLPFTGTHVEATEKPEATHAAGDNHAHTVSIEGVLKAYNAGAATITVTGTVHSDDSKPEATEKPEATAKPEATKGAEATEKPDATKTTTTTTMTITVNANTKVNGDHVSTLADLSKNIGHKVQVQADKQSNGSLVAWKVTVQGADSQSGDDGKSSNDGQSHVLQGKVKSVGSGSFVIQLADGSTKTVTVNAQTQFRGSAHSLTDLKASEHVSVQGTSQSNGTFLATSVQAGGDN